jgi:choloylglycine hydrolase
MARDGAKAEPDTVVTENPTQWASKRGSLVTSIHGIGSADGFNEAVKLMEDIQVVMVEATGQRANVHLAIEDARGDSAIIE